MADSEKICVHCGIIKSKTEFSPRKGTKDGLASWCKPCRREKYNGRYNDKRRDRWKNDPKLRERNKIAAKKYQLLNKEKIKTNSRKVRQAKREAVIIKYGGKCACCGEGNLLFLCIDHIHNNGATERKEIGGSNGVYNKLINEEVLADQYQVLCYNCNSAKEIYGICPHKTQRDRIFVNGERQNTAT